MLLNNSGGRLLFQFRAAQSQSLIQHLNKYSTILTKISGNKSIETNNLKNGSIATKTPKAISSSHFLIHRKYVQANNINVVNNNIDNRQVFFYLFTSNPFLFPRMRNILKVFWLEFDHKDLTAIIK